MILAKSRGTNINCFWLVSCAIFLGVILLLFFILDFMISGSFQDNATKVMAWVLLSVSLAGAVLGGIAVFHVKGWQRLVALLLLIGALAVSFHAYFVIVFSISF